MPLDPKEAERLAAQMQGEGWPDDLIVQRLRALHERDDLTLQRLRDTGEDARPFWEEEGAPPPPRSHAYQVPGAAPAAAAAPPQPEWGTGMPIPRPGGDPSRPPLGEFGPDGKLYPIGTGNHPFGYEYARMLYDVAKGPARFAKKQALPLAGTILGGVGGRAVANAIPALQGAGVWPAIGRALAPAAGEAAGMFTGTLARQRATGEPLDLREAGENAAWQGGLATAMALGSYAMGRAGDVEPRAARSAAGRPDFVKRVPDDALDVQARRIHKVATEMPMTQSRLDLERLIETHDHAGKTIDILDAMRHSEPYTRGGVSPAIQASGEQMKGVQERLLGRLLDEAPSGKITAEAFDRVIREELTGPLQQQLGVELGGPETAQRMVRLRGDLQGVLYDSLGGNARELGKQTAAAMTARDKVLDYFKVDEYGDPQMGTPGRVAGAGSRTSPSGATLLKKLQELDPYTRTDLAGEAQRLSDRIEWSPKDRRRAAILLQLTGRSFGEAAGTRNALRSLARMLVRSQGITGAAARGYYTTKKERKEPSAEAQAPPPPPSTGLRQAVRAQGR